MKTTIQLFQLLLAALATCAANGQVPHTLHYQGIARTTLGGPLVNEIISIRLSIKDAASGGSVLYTETKTVTTNALGLYAIVINDGQGSVSGNFNGIDWSDGARFLQTEIDTGNGFVDMGTAQLHSATTAMVAENLAGVVNPVEGDRLEFRGGKWKRRAARQIILKYGGGVSPSTSIGFIGAYIEVTITDHENQYIKAHLNKFLGTTAATGAQNLDLTIGYIKKAGDTWGPFLSTSGDPIVNSYYINNMQVPQGTRVPVTLNAAFKVAENGIYRIGIVGASNNAADWNYNEGGISYVEID